MSSIKKPKAVTPKPAAGKAPAEKKKAPVSQAVKVPSISPDEIVFAREYWTGDSRDGALVNGDGYHYYRMTKTGKILEAYEAYEMEDGRECANPCPEMMNIHWMEDLGYEDFEILDFIKEIEFSRVKDLSNGIESA